MKIIEIRTTPCNGRIGLLDGPGLGFELNRDAVAQAAERYRQDEHYHHV